MSQAFTSKVLSSNAGVRLDVYLADMCAYKSRSAAAKACECGLVLVNGKPASKKTILECGDFVFAEYEQEEIFGLVGQDIPLDIRYEDEDLLVISKQAGLVCHPSDDHKDNTLVNALIAHCGAEHLCNVQGEDDRLGIVHRLDMDTTGLMLAAKSNEAGRALMESIRVRAVDRHYIALVHGQIPHDTGLIDAPISRHAQDRLRMAVRDIPQARDAMTTFSVLERFEAGKHDNGYTLIDCKLFTGRTHQIRVHMEYARHPLVGDPLYTTHAPHYEQASLGLARQFLHSFRLGFEHPINGENLEFVDHIPDDLEDCLCKIKERSLGLSEAGRALCGIIWD